MRLPSKKTVVSIAKYLFVGFLIAATAIFTIGAVDKGLSAEFTKIALMTAGAFTLAAYGALGVVGTVSAIKSTRRSLKKSRELQKEVTKDQDIKIIDKNVDTSKIKDQIKVNEGTIEAGLDVKDAISEALAQNNPTAMRSALVKSNAYVTTTNKCLAKDNETLENVEKGVDSAKKEIRS